LSDDAEISEGLLRCRDEHWFPIVRGIPRMLPQALREHWPLLSSLVGPGQSPAVRQLNDRLASANGQVDSSDRITSEHFSLEWQHHELGDETWGIPLQARVKDFFLKPIRIPPDQLDGMVLLDAGCGNGSQSVAYTEFGLDVIAMDISTGLEHGNAFRHHYPKGRPDRIHFVQADLQTPPLAPRSVDIIHSAGVLHHTPDTRRTFRALRPLLRPSGTFYVWLYLREPWVTLTVNFIRRATTRMPPARFARVADVTAPVFQLFCWAINGVGIRTYPRMQRREAALALLDIFGAPYAHYHSFPEVAHWYRDEGFGQPWECNRSRRGFGICGRLSPANQPEEAPCTSSG
jgi:SAM-dependent methyltransferase